MKKYLKLATVLALSLTAATLTLAVPDGWMLAAPFQGLATILATSW